MNHDHSQHAREPTSFWRSRYAIGLLVLGGIAAYFLLSEHRAHLLGALPFLILLACPLMHIFMHHGHGGHAGHQGRSESVEQGDSTPTPSQPGKTGGQP
ncbi:MAG: DUF2933 domain-containing protein [Burkholderiaceae bacterium]|nr:DUF2933 domain-containing protein [Burkholderiaceae bacterium]